MRNVRIVQTIMSYASTRIVQTNYFTHLTGCRLTSIHDDRTNDVLDAFFALAQVAGLPEVSAGMIDRAMDVVGILADDARQSIPSCLSFVTTCAVVAAGRSADVGREEDRYEEEEEEEIRGMEIIMKAANQLKRRKFAKILPELIEPLISRLMASTKKRTNAHELRCALVLAGVTAQAEAKNSSDRPSLDPALAATSYRLLAHPSGAKMREQNLRICADLCQSKCAIFLLA